MLIVNFNRGNDVARAVRSAWQYDYGQKLYIHGLDLPEVVEIGFSLTESGGMDNPRFGVTKDGVTEVIIPDAMMAGEDTEYDYKIYAFIFVEDGNQESGRTVKRADISVKSRPKRWMYDETGDNFSEIVKAVRDLVEEYKKSGVSDEQVKAALNDYLSDHPIDTLTEDEVRAIVNAMLGDVTQTHFEKVDVLPDDWNENIIYLVPAENTEEQNIYDEYIFLNGIPELIGTTKINLEGYATKEELRQLSDAKIDKTIFEKLLSKLGYTMEDFQEIIKSLPSVYLVGDLTGISADDYVNVTCNFVDETNNVEFTDYAEIAWQGSSSVNFKKEIDGVDVAKNYKIKLYSDEARETKNKRTFKDWHATNNYHIKCNYADCTNFMNNMMMHYLTKTYQYLTPLPREGARYTVDGFPIKLYINGVFCGIRFWNLKQDDKVYNLNETDLCYQVGLHDGTNQGNNSGAFVYGNLNNGQFADAHAEIDYYWEDRVWDKTGNHPSVLYDTIQWVSEAMDEEFKANLEQHFNKEYLINYFVMMYACGMIDSKGKNFNMLYFPDIGQWFATFWDMDNAFGTYYTMKTTEYNIELNRFGCPTSRLFDKLWANFKEECKAKYWQLRQTVLTVEQVKDSIKAVWSDFVDADLIAENEATKYDNTSYDGLFKMDGFGYVTEWARKRFAYMDIVMSFEISATELNFSSFDSQTLTVSVETTEEILWSSSSNAIATVKNGVVTPVKNGDCVITVTIGDFKATCNVTVNVEVDEEKGLYVNGYVGNQGVMTAGTDEYTATAYKEVAGGHLVKVSFADILETSKSTVTTIRIAEYDENKTFIARQYKAGDVIQLNNYSHRFIINSATKYVRVGFVTTLTNETALNDLFSNYTTNCELQISATELTFTESESQTLTITTTSNEEIAWTSSDETVATVVDGVVTPVGNGDCVITATQGNTSAICGVTVNIIIYENGFIKDSGLFSGNTGNVTNYTSKHYDEVNGTITVDIANALQSKDYAKTLRIAEYNSNKTFIKRGYKAISNYSASYTLDENTAYVRIGFEMLQANMDSAILSDLFENYTITSA